MGGEECIYAMSTETSAATAAATEIRRAGAASVLQMLTPHDVDSHLVPENAMSRSNGPQLRRQLALDHLGRGIARGRTREALSSVSDDAYRLV